MRKQVQCEVCGKLIATCGIKSHLRFHENEKRRQNEREYKKLARSDRDDLFCKFCSKQCKNLNSLTQHEIRCKENPNRISSSLLISYCNSGRPAWNKGLTADTDPRIAKMKEAARSKYVPKDELQYELDDDKKLYSKYLNKCNNARFAGVHCLLTFHEYCLLVKEAGLKSSDLGYSGRGYDLARIGDEGDYTYGNCRFITHRQNTQERQYSETALSKMKASAKNRKPLTEEEKEIRVQKFLNSDYIKRRKEEAAIREAERRSKLDPRFSGEHNSQFGTRWITNGEINKKLHPGDEIPEGFYFGCVNANKKQFDK